MKQFHSTNVYDAALQRTVDAFKEGHRMIVAFSAGKDSMAVLELAIEAARKTGRLPVEVWMRDEEIMYPGTYEYAERVANRKEVNFHWLISGQASVNIFNRKNPYYWVFDNRLDSSQWMRQPPSIAQWVDEQSLYNVVNPQSFPPPEGKFLYVVMGVRGAESRRRNMLIHKSNGALSGVANDKTSKIDRKLEKHFRPIYDWSTKDVWLATKEKGWDYNKAYDTFTRLGIKTERQRIAPIAMDASNCLNLLQAASKGWPEWFERLTHRLPGTKLAALYGKTALQPIRRPTESWQEAYQRLCIDDAPAWIAQRAELYRETVIRKHAAHSNEPIMEIASCPTCSMGRVSWQKMTHNMYFGDPFLTATGSESLGYVEPETFRIGAGKWGGKPTM